MRDFTLVVLCALITAVVSAQDYRGSVVGRVTDGTGAVVPGANITVVNEGTNVPSATRSNGEGHYRNCNEQTGCDLHRFHSFD